MMIYDDLWWYNMLIYDNMWWYMTIHDNIWDYIYMIIYIHECISRLNYFGDHIPTKIPTSDPRLQIMTPIPVDQVDHCAPCCAPCPRHAEPWRPPPGESPARPGQPRCRGRGWTRCSGVSAWDGGWVGTQGWETPRVDEHTKHTLW